MAAKSGIHTLTMFNNGYFSVNPPTSNKISIDRHFELLEGYVQAVVTSVFSNNKGHSYLNIAFSVKGQTVFLGKPNLL